MSQTESTETKLNLGELSKSNSTVRRFSTLAGTLVSQSPRGADRCRTFYLDSSLLEISSHLIGCSGTSEIFRGTLGGKTVAIKQLRMDVVMDRDRKELADLIREICLMCRSVFLLQIVTKWINMHLLP